MTHCIHLDPWVACVGTIINDSCVGTISPVKSLLDKDVARVSKEHLASRAVPKPSAVLKDSGFDDFAREAETAFHGADHDGDGELTMNELATFIKSNPDAVRSVTEPGSIHLYSDVAMANPRMTILCIAQDRHSGAI